MRRATWIRGRRGAVAGVSTVLVCLGGVLAACGGGGSGGDGYVAVGSGGNSPPGAAVAPTGDVTFVPLEEAAPPKPAQPAGPDRDTGNASGSPGSSRPNTSGTDGTLGTATPDSDAGLSESPGDESTDGTEGTDSTESAESAENTEDAEGTDSTEPGRTTTTTPGSPTPSAPSGRPPAPGSTAPPGPAKLTVGTPEREPAEERWCEKVTVEFRNTGGTAVRSGTVTFGTHIIGALGIDWATIESTEDLPVPIAPGAARTETWTVCVDAWRVPLGMHIETRDVTVQWK
ncbi:hypothetical protein [Streptomyces sp. NPDC002845]